MLVLSVQQRESIFLTELIPHLKSLKSNGYTLFISVHLLSYVQLFATPWTAALQASLSSAISQSLLKLISIESVMQSNHLILCRPLLFLPSVFPSIRSFSMCQLFTSAGQSVGPPASIFSISPSNEYSGLISFRMEWFDLLVV